LQDEPSALLKLCQSVGKQEVLRGVSPFAVHSLSEAFIAGRQHRSRGLAPLDAVRKKEGLTARLISNIHVRLIANHAVSVHIILRVLPLMLTHSHGIDLQLKAYVAGYFSWPRNRANIAELVQLCALANKSVTPEDSAAAIESLDSMPWLMRFSAIHVLVCTFHFPVPPALTYRAQSSILHVVLTGAVSDGEGPGTPARLSRVTNRQNAAEVRPRIRLIEVRCIMGQTTAQA
jgi:hypothetical protein